MRRFALLFLILISASYLFADDWSNFELIPAEAKNDRYVLPMGAGRKDGSSWKDAFDASSGGLQKAVDNVSQNGSVWIGSGTYLNISVDVKTGGRDGVYKKVIGRDTGGGLPHFIGTFDKAKPAASGKVFIELQKGVRDLWVQDLRLNNYQFGIRSKGGRHKTLRFKNIDANGCRECISLDGGATLNEPGTGSHDIEISDCELVNYTKRGVRLFNGNHNVRITNSTADGGGKEWATEFFQMGFQISKKDTDTEKTIPDHDITFINCVARNNYDNAGDKYWNADGFVAEEGSRNLRFINCKAFDNTDGGWDDKSTGTTYEGCIALRNKRNFRIWGEVRMFRTIGAYSVFPGGNGDDLGIWASGKVVAESCTFHNNGNGIKVVENGSVTLINSIVSGTKEWKGKLIVLDGPDARFVNNGSVLWQEGDSTQGPGFLDPVRTWDGRGKSFDSKTYGKQKGFYGL